jgi:hypothetical protein
VYRPIPGHGGPLTPLRGGTIPEMLIPCHYCRAVGHGDCGNQLIEVVIWLEIAYCLLGPPHNNKTELFSQADVIGAIGLA